MNEFNENLWAPWRMEYIHQLSGTQQLSGCFLCDYHAAPASDAENHVIARRDGSMVLMNRFPYTNGHLLIAPASHKADLDDLDDQEMRSIWWLTRDAKRMLAEALKADGFNVGINFGRCAGAGLPGHLHIHIVPRWNGDTNFMAVLGDVRVVPQSLKKLYDQLRLLAPKFGMPTD